MRGQRWNQKAKEREGGWQTLIVLHAEFVEDGGGIQTGVFSDLTGNDLEGLSKGVDDELLLAVDCARKVSQELAELHLLIRETTKRSETRNQKREKERKKEKERERKRETSMAPPPGTTELY